MHFFLQIIYISSTFFYRTRCIGKHTDKILHRIITRCIHSSICVLNFILPACRSNFAEVARMTLEPEQAQFLCTRCISWRQKTKPYAIAFQVTRSSPSATAFNWPESIATACGVYGNNSQPLVFDPQPPFSQKTSFPPQ